MLPKLVPTNIPGLDSMLGGGLLPGTILLLESEQIPEAELMFLQIAEEAAKHREKFFFLTIEHSPEEVKQMARKYGWNYGKAEQAKNLYWIDCYSKKAGKKTKKEPSIIRIGSPVALANISSTIAKIEATFYKTADYHKAVFLSINELAKYNSRASTMRFITYLSDLVKRAGAIAFFLFYREPEMEDLADKVRKLADARIKIIGSGGHLFLEVVDLPFLSFLGRSFGEITKNKGELVFGKAEGSVPRYTFVVK